MKRWITPLLLLLVAAGCQNEKQVPNTDIDVARTFIRDVLDSDFKGARELMLADSSNQEYFNLFEKEYKGKSKEEREQYHQAEIIINEISNVNDSVTIVNYSNSFKSASSSKVKVVRVHGQWKVDFKYTFSGNM